MRPEGGGLPQGVPPLLVLWNAALLHCTKILRGREIAGQSETELQIVRKCPGDSRDTVHRFLVIVSNGRRRTLRFLLKNTFEPFWENCVFAVWKWKCWTI